jgi:predicted PurR-regulated permease PerM
MHSDFYRRCFQIAIAALLGYALFRMLDPLLRTITWAVVLAFSLYPLHEWLTRKLRGRAALSASIITALTPFLVVAPLAVLGVAFAGQVTRLIGFVRGHPSVSFNDVVGRVEAYPMIGPAIGWVRDNVPVSFEQVQGWLTNSVEALLKSLASMGGGVALGVVGALVSFFLMLFMLFYFLSDGRAMLDALTRLIPVERGRRAQLLKYLGDVTRAVVFGSVATALIQGVIIGIGFAIARLPSPLVFGVLGAVMAFLPGGSGVVMVPAILYVGLTGRWGAAIFLACWTALLWIVENVLRLVLTRHHAQVSTLAIFLGAIGGAAAFGILGLLVGPVLLSFAVALVRFATESLPAEA